MIAHAQEATAVATQFVAKINAIILFPLITLMTVVALVVFLYGAMEYVLNANNDAKKTEGRKHILWGIIGLLVMVSAYAILTIAANTIPGVEVPDPIGASTAPLTSPTPAARPGGVAATPAPIPRPGGACKTYSAGGCTPSAHTDPEKALREELQYTGGIGVNRTGLMAVQAVFDGDGSLELGVRVMDEYRAGDFVSEQTYKRVMRGMLDASPRTLEDDMLRNKVLEALAE